MTYAYPQENSKSLKLTLPQSLADRNLPTTLRHRHSLFSEHLLALQQPAEAG